MVEKAGAAAVQGPDARMSQQQLLDTATTNFQVMGTGIGNAMDRAGVNREGIAGVPPSTIRVPHDGRATPDQLRNVQTLMQSYVDKTFRGSGITVRVDGAE